MKISVITMLRFHLFNLVEELSKFDNEISFTYRMEIRRCSQTIHV